MGRSNVAAATLADARSTLTSPAAWGLVDQGLISASSFLTTYILARAFTPSQFGDFVIGYTTLLLANNVQMALITQPLNVLGVKRSGDDYRGYVSSLFLGNAAFSLLSIAVMSILAAGAHLGGWDDARIFGLIIPLTVCYQLQEFLRRVLYTQDRIRAAFVTDIVSYVGQVVIIAGLWYTDNLTLPAVFYTMAGTSAVAAVLALVPTWDAVTAPVGYLRRDLRATWEYGKWLIGAYSGSWASLNANRYLLALFWGSSATAAFAAAEVLLRPLVTFYSFLDSILPIKFARARSSGVPNDVIARAFVLSVLPVLLFCAFMFGASSRLLDLLYSGQYNAAGTAVKLFAVYYAIFYLNIFLMAVLKAGESMRAIFFATLAAATVCLALAVPLIAYLKLEGAVLALMAYTLVFAVLAWRAVNRTESARAVDVRVLPELDRRRPREAGR